MKFYKCLNCEWSKKWTKETKNISREEETVKQKMKIKQRRQMIIWSFGMNWMLENFYKLTKHSRAIEIKWMRLTTNGYNFFIQFIFYWNWKRIKTWIMPGIHRSISQFLLKRVWCVNWLLLLFIWIIMCKVDSKMFL